MIKRHIQELLIESLRHFPVVLLLGARQVGKSTLAQALPGKSWPARYLTLDDRTVLDAALLNPEGFIDEAGLPVIIDEVQRAPELLLAIKKAVDRRRSPGMFLLTGSANVLTLSTVSETLAGRVAVHELYPFGWAELKQRPVPRTLNILFSARSTKEALRHLPKSSPAERPREIKALILSGGFPTPALMDKPRPRGTWFESYRQTYIERDLRGLADISHVPEFSRLLSTLAWRTGQLLNVSELSRDTGLSNTTLRRYFNILTQTYQIFLVPPYSANVGKRLVKTPKLYLSDTGMVCHLNAAEQWETLVRQNRMGAMVETWVANEIRKMLSVSALHTSLCYFRTSIGHEVDFILDRGTDLVGIEVKWAAGVKEHDLAGLRSCRETLGDRLRLGVLLHGGTEALALEERILALPFGVLLGRERLT